MSGDAAAAQLNRYLLQEKPCVETSNNCCRIASRPLSTTSPPFVKLSRLSTPVAPPSAIARHMDRTQSRQVGQLAYSSISPQLQARGVNGPLFSKVSCGGGNANGPLMKILANRSAMDQAIASKSSRGRPDLSIAYVSGALPSSDEDIMRLIPPRAATPPPKDKMFKPKIPCVWPTASTLCCTNSIGITNVAGQLLPSKTKTVAPTFSQAPRPCLDFTAPPPLSHKHSLKAGESFYVLPFPEPYRYPDEDHRKT